MQKYLHANKLKRTSCFGSLPALFLLLLLSAMSFTTSAQGQVVSGTVISDDDKSPLPGVTVLEKGTSNGTSTDSDGKFSLRVSDQNATLILTFIGYAAQEVALNGRTTLDVSMQSDITQLSEVVVVGYGTVKKSDLTGSVVNIDNEQLTKRGSVSALEGVQGRVAGVDVSNPTGRAGAGFKIQIRGQQSLKGGNPLYVVDGVIMDGIDFLNPQDIERMDILKDASSTAIYGSRGAYGVVIVTTKKGAVSKGKATISYDGYYGVREPARLPDFMDGDTWWNFRQDAYITPALLANQAYDQNAGNNTTNKDELNRRVAEKDYTDWPAQLLQNGTQQNHWLSVSGANDKMAYNIGFGYQQEKGNVVHEDFTRYNFKAGVNHTLNDNWSTGASFNLAVADLEQGSVNAMVNAFRMNPLLKPYYTDRPNEVILQPGKDLPYIDMTSSVNPMVDMENAKNDRRTYNVIGNVFLEFAPVEWIRARSTFAPSYRYMKNGSYAGKDSEGRVGLLGFADMKTVESFSYVWDNQVTVEKQVNDHSFNAMGLFSLNSFRHDSTYLSGNNLPFNSGYDNIGSAPTEFQRSDTHFVKSSLASFAIRLNYAFREKYLLTLSDRWDGSSVLSEGNKWASFPSAAISWKISEESFLTDVNMVDHLALRLSYGFTGNNVIDPYTTNVAASLQTYYDFGGTNAGGFAPGGLGNKNLQWERTSELNFGVDYSLFQARVSGSVDVYNRLSEDLLLLRDLPLEMGFKSVWDNVGSVRNSGIEVVLNTVNIQKNDFTWSTSFNFTKNKNEIVELFGANEDLIGQKWFIGQPVNVNYTYVFDGIWQESDRDQAVSYGQLPGQARVKDIDKNGVINALDRRIIGTSMPKWTGGFSTTVTFKGFDLNASLFTRQGVQVYSPFHEEFLNFDDRGRQKLDVNWYMAENDVTPTRASNEYPQPKNFGPYWRTASGVAAYKDASFVKVKNITLGYTIPGSIASRAKFSSIRVYANVLNPFVFTDYEGFDPEWAGATYQNGGISSITYQFGVNLKL
jgi:TonB-dependent starch-binding outer membrane protein SusC